MALLLPQDCEVIANTFIIFKWQNQCCLLQANLILYCWGGRRSGALEHVLKKYGWTNSPQLYRINSKVLSPEQWRWLKQIFITVHRMFDDKETCDTTSKIHWLNIIDCRLAYQLLRRECYYYQRHLYPVGSSLAIYLKHHGIEIEEWYYSLSDEQTVAHSWEDSPLLEQHHENLSIVLSSGSSSSHLQKSPSSSALGEFEWLSDIHIANLMFLLIHGQLNVPLEYRDHFQYIYPMTDDLFIEMLQRDQRSAIAESGSLLMHAKSGQGVSFIFINPQNNHWRLIILDGTQILQQRIILFDPLGTALSSSITAALNEFMTSISYQIVDLQLCLQAENWNCGIWCLYVASRYIIATVEHLNSVLNEGEDDTSEVMDFKELLLQQLPSDVIVLNERTPYSQQYPNKLFANELRNQYSHFLVEAAESGRLLYTNEDRHDEGAAIINGQEEEEEDADAYPIDYTDIISLRSPKKEPTEKNNKNSNPMVVLVGSANQAIRRHKSISHLPPSEFIWIDFSEEINLIDDEEEEEAMEQNYDDLCDNFIEFREDNINASAANLKYSLPIKFQSEELKQQIADFRAYRRQRFSLFRKGPLVEETTIAGNISSLIRFLGYLFYEHKSTVEEQNGSRFDMSVFTLSNINYLVLHYVEWLEQRRGVSRHRRQASPETSFQSISPATVANYLNGLVSIVKYQLQEDIHRRDALLDQLRNLRSQAESYSMTQKKFEKVHPEWCSWQELQIARENCRRSFASFKLNDDDHNVSSSSKSKVYLLHLREVVLLCLFTICPPTRCSIIRLLEWNKTLVAKKPTLLAKTASLSNKGQEWVIDLTDLSHAATKHKTYKHKGAMVLPLPKVIYPYLNELHNATVESSLIVFPPGLSSGRVKRSLIRRIAEGVSSQSFMDSTAFNHFVKATFRKYTEKQKAPNPSLLRSIFTTWLYSLRYDTEDIFLQQIKSSSAKWKAHSERIAGTVYNKELIYQQEEFSQLLHFCEVYAEQFSSTQPKNPALPARKKQKKEASSVESTEMTTDDKEYVVEKLLKVQVNKQGEKQVLVKWEGYVRPTWEPYSSIQTQLPELMRKLEEQEDQQSECNNSISTFLTDYINEHHITAITKWTANELNTLESAAINHQISISTDRLRKQIMNIVA